MSSNLTSSAATCYYGCGRFGVFFFKTTKRWCCSSSVNSCPAKCKRDSDLKKGKNPFEGREHPRGMKGKKPWNQGRKLDVDHRRKISESLQSSMKITGRASTPEKEQERRRKISQKAKRNNGGYRKGSGRSKGCWYDSPSAGQVYLDSTWELAYARWLDARNISWERNLRQFDYTFEGKASSYIPDFYLPESDEFIEIKGYVVDRDYAKWSALRESHALTVLMGDDLKDMGVL